MQLIADSGSTKLDWRLVGADGFCVAYETIGINPVFMSSEDIMNILTPLADQIGPGVTDIHFYGAGILGVEPVQKLRDCFKEAFPGSNAEIVSDMLGTARAACGRGYGIACILGTGSNSCFYDGVQIVSHTAAGGYILGDEGSGSAMGKKLLSDYIKGCFPENLDEEFWNEFHLDYPAIVKHVYNEPLPARFLASFAPFVHKHKQDPYMHAMIVDGFVSFLQRNVLPYGVPEFPVSFVGSIAYYFAEELEEAIRICGLNLGVICKAPIEGLVKYHTSK